MPADYFAFKRCITNILLLAVCGVLINTFLVGLCLKLLLGYSELTWSIAFMIGALFSPTDPTSIVAIIKTVKSHYRFNALIDGESALNGSIAVIIFQLCYYNAVNSIQELPVSSPTYMIGSFLTLSLGGPVLGFLGGLLGSQWLRRIVRDDVLTVNVSIICCYLLFYFAEYSPMFHVSGILAVVVLGFLMNTVGRTKIY